MDDEKWCRAKEIGEEFFDIECFRNVKEQYIVLYTKCGSIDQQKQNWIRLEEGES